MWTFYFLLKVQFSRIDNVSNYCDETVSYNVFDIAEILPLWLKTLNNQAIDTVPRCIIMKWRQTENNQLTLLQARFYDTYN